MRGWRMSDDDVRRQWVIQHLMCHSVIDPGAYQAAFDEPLAELVPDLEAQLAGFIEDGLLERLGDGYRLTAVGRVLARPVAMTFDAYIRGEDGEQRFSRTV